MRQSNTLKSLQTSTPSGWINGGGNRNIRDSKANQNQQNMFQSHFENQISKSPMGFALEHKENYSTGLNLTTNNPSDKNPRGIPNFGHPKAS
jgi:hypothetical protein